MRAGSRIILICEAVIAVAAFIADIALGSVRLPLGDIVKALSGAECDEAVRNIVLNFRLPKALTAVLSGMALSCAGLQMQTLFRNPLAGPYVLGVSSGASLGVALFLLGMPIFGIHEAGAIRELGTVGAAWIGAAIIMAAVMAVSARVKDIMVVLILGIMFGSAASALTDMLQYLSDETALKSFVVWTMGSLGGVTSSQLRIVIPVLICGLVMSLAMIKPLNMLLLGERYAASMGLNIRRTHVLISVTTVMLAGTVTAFCGPIGFIGLAVPHISRMLFREADHRILMPAAILTGAATMLLCDIVSQLPGSGYAIPINTVTSLVGIPVIIAVIIRNRNTSAR